MLVDNNSSWWPGLMPAEKPIAQVHCEFVVADRWCTTDLQRACPVAQGHPAGREMSQRSLSLIDPTGPTVSAPPLGDGPNNSLLPPGAGPPRPRLSCRVCALRTGRVWPPVVERRESSQAPGEPATQRRSPAPRQHASAVLTTRGVDCDVHGRDNTAVWCHEGRPWINSLMSNKPRTLLESGLF